MSEKTIAEKLTEIAEGIPQIRQKAYAEGYNNGINSADAYETGYEAGVEAGKQAEYDAFWDAIQDYGKRTMYAYAFTGDYWNNENLKPKYPIKFNDATVDTRSACGMFMWFHRSYRTPATYAYDMSEICKLLDFSQCKSVDNLFAAARVKNLTLDFSNVEKMSNTFACNDGGYYDNVVIKVSEKCTSYNATCFYSSGAEKLIFTDDSVIAASIDFHYSNKLTPESLMSIINALKDYSGTGTTKTLTLGTTNLAKLTDAEKAIATQKGWDLA